MGVSTRSTLIEQIRYSLDNRQDLTDVQIMLWLDWTLYHITNPKVYVHQGLKAYDTVVLAAGTAEYNLTGTTYVIGVRNTTASSGYPLVPKGRSWFRQRRQDQTGRPNYYMRDTDGDYVTQTLKVYPVPSAEYGGQELEVEEIARPIPFALAGDVVSPLEWEWDEVLVLGGIWRGWRHLRNYPLADRAKADYAAMINEIGDVWDVEKGHDPRDFEITVGDRTSRY